MDDLFLERKWYNIIDKLIESYSSNIIDHSVNIYTEKLLNLVSIINPQRLTTLFKLYFQKNNFNLQTKTEIIKKIISGLENPLEKTKFHKKAILFFEILKTNFSMDEENVEVQVYKFKEMNIFKDLTNTDELKIELHELLLKYFEKQNNLKEAAYYAHKLGENEKYINYTLYSDNLEKIDVEITNLNAKEAYEKMINGEFQFFKNEDILKKKAYCFFILKKCYANAKINLHNLSQEMNLNLNDTLLLVLNLLSNSKISGFIDNEFLIIFGVLAVSKLERLKSEYENWIGKIDETIYELEKEVKS